MPKKISPTLLALQPNLKTAFADADFVIEKYAGKRMAAVLIVADPDDIENFDFVTNMNPAAVIDVTRALSNRLITQNRKQQAEAEYDAKRRKPTRPTKQ